MSGCVPYYNSETTWVYSICSTQTGRVGVRLRLLGMCTYTCRVLFYRTSVLLLRVLS
jgi:hypothetical protein